MAVDILANKITKEKSWATGPLGKCFGEFALPYTAAALVADLSQRDPQLYNGTATLLELGSKKVAITCAHVLEKYTDLRRSERKAIFQIGNIKLDPISQLIAEDHKTDLATILLSDEQAGVMEKNGRQFFLPVSWPPGLIKEGDWVALGGYPGILRKQVSWNELDLIGYSVGATPVTSVTEEKLGCRFERERWVWGYRSEGMREPENLGGLSGGPAFILRQLHWELAGIMFEFSASFDIMFLRPAHMIHENGSIAAIL